MHRRRAKVAIAKLRLEMGHTSRVKWFDGIGEYVIDWGPGYRIYLARDGECLIVLFGDGTKRGQQPARRRSLPTNERGEAMALTRDFKQTVIERVERDPAFARALLDEAATLFLNGEAGVARVVLRDLVNATLGFEQLAAATAKPSKSLHRMLSPRGNPSMDNLAVIFQAVGRRLGVGLEVHVVEMRT